MRHNDARHRRDDRFQFTAHHRREGLMAQNEIAGRAGDDGKRGEGPEALAEPGRDHVTHRGCVVGVGLSHCADPGVAGGGAQWSWT